MSKVSFLGAGSWGTALAIMIAKSGHDVMLWSAVASEIDMLESNREHKDRLPGVKLPDSITLTKNLENSSTDWRNTSASVTAYGKQAVYLDYEGTGSLELLEIHFSLKPSSN